MLANERRLQILDEVRHKGFASLPELASSLNVSESTIRRDLVQLEREGAARRTHGGAFYTGPSPRLPHFDHRQEAEWGRKKAIAKLAAGWIEDGDTVLLDGGSTTYEVAQLLVTRPLQIVTNSLPVANLLCGSTEIDLTVIGGMIHNRSGTAIGPLADAMLQSINVHRAILSTAGINERGLFNNNLDLVNSQRAMMATADQVAVVADSTKFGRQSLAHLCTLSEIGRLFVDSELAVQWQQQLTASDVTFELAPLQSETLLPSEDETNG